MTLLNKKTSTVISIMHQTSITNHQLSMNQTNNHQSSTIINNNHVSSIIHHPSSIITHQSTITSSTKTFSTIPLTPSSSLNKNKRFNTNHSISHPGLLSPQISACGGVHLRGSFRLLSGCCNVRRGNTFEEFGVPLGIGGWIEILDLSGNFEYTPEVQHSPWKMVAGRLLSNWEAKFSGAMLNFQGVIIPVLKINIDNLVFNLSLSSTHFVVSFLSKNIPDFKRV